MSAHLWASSSSLDLSFSQFSLCCAISFSLYYVPALRGGGCNIKMYWSISGPWVASDQQWVSKKLLCRSFRWLILSSMASMADSVWQQLSTVCLCMHVCASVSVCGFVCACKCRVYVAYSLPLCVCVYLARGQSMSYYLCFCGWSQLIMLTWLFVTASWHHAIGCVWGSDPS